MMDTTEVLSEIGEEGASSEPLRRWDINKLNQWYNDSEACDKKTFSEMRSSLLLIAGDHYAKLNDKFYERIKTSRDLSQETKIRLTKNHIGRIHKTYVNNIITYAPGVFVAPKNEKELQDIKASELSNSIWMDARAKLNYEDQVSQWADDFCGIAEVWTKIYFDPYGGRFLGYEPQTDELGQPMFEKMEIQEQVLDGTTGLPLTDEAGRVVMQTITVDNPEAPILDRSKPIFEGELKFEEIHGFNVFRSAEAKTLRESEIIAIRKMVSVDRLKRMFPDPDKQKMIAESSDKTFLVFDTTNGGYRKSEKNECLVREFFHRPNADYPEGYYWITTETGILDEGELPFGIFPIEGEPFDTIQTSARGRGIVKQIRPYQIEINRCASKIAEHQMTLGDDKLVVWNGSKISSGGQVPGVRSINVQGAQAPTILPGRNGAQFLEYMQSQISEMYQVAMVEEDNRKETNGQLDPYALLFKSASQKKMYKRHIKKFESFLKRVCRLYLRMAKHYLSDDAIVFAVGKKERINISEFKNTNDINTEVVVDARSDDVETLMGKQLVMNHLIQYTGNQLSREDIGKLIKNMPYANVGEDFSDFTLDYDTSTNLILALDRGEMPEINQTDDQVYIVKKLNARMNQSDFNQLHPYIQQNYKRQRDARNNLINIMKQQLIMDNQGMIPMTGALVDSGVWIPDPEDASKTKRLRLPQDAVYWLYQKLQRQGFMQAELNSMGTEANYVRSVQMIGPQGQATQGQPVMQQGQGQMNMAPMSNVPPPNQGPGAQ